MWLGMRNVKSNFPRQIWDLNFQSKLKEKLLKVLQSSTDSSECLSHSWARFSSNFSFKIVPGLENIYHCLVLLHVSSSLMSNYREWSGNSCACYRRQVRIPCMRMSGNGTKCPVISKPEVLFPVLFLIFCLTFGKLFLSLCLIYSLRKQG